MGKVSYLHVWVLTTSVTAELFGNKMVEKAHSVSNMVGNVGKQVHNLSTT